MYAQVIVQINIKSNRTFTYKVPSFLIEKIYVGSKVKVPFGKKEVKGIVTSIFNKFNEDYEVKEIIALDTEDIVLNDELLELGKWMSEDLLCPLVQVYETMLPNALKMNNKVSNNIKTQKYIKLVDENYKEYNATNAQKKIIDLLIENKFVLKKDVSLSILKTLISKNIVTEFSEEVYRLEQKDKKVNEVKLTDKQQKVYESVELNKNKVYLLHGVTGSGKTEIYLNLVDDVLKMNKTAIVLLPEISLTTQILKRFQDRFGNSIAAFHSKLSSGEKYDEYRRIIKGEAKVVVGARSAIFAPVENLGIIIIDEEQSDAYKQENNPKYDAIEIAKKRAIYHNVPVLIGSATPSLESYYKALNNEYELLKLEDRVNGSTLPDVHIIDMKDEYKKRNFLLSELLKNKIQEKLDKNEQVILLLNRRGYNTHLLCSNCGHTPKCPNCDITLTFHKGEKVLKCHYCGYASREIKKCAKCNNESLKGLGIGTERVEEEIKQTFPTSKVLRMDIDSTTRKGAHEQIIESFAKGEANILLGTQMIAKGLDFKNVTLVGIINGDTSLNIPDFKSSEKTYELLSQASGRAGRKEKKGEVVIQTFNPDHYAIEVVKRHKYEEFYNKDIEFRRKLLYPPFINLALIKISTEDFDIGKLESVKISKFLNKELNNNEIVIGPSISSLGKINNTYYFQIIIKYKDKSKMIDKLERIINHYNTNTKVKVDVNFNPVRI